VTFHLGDIQFVYKTVVGHFWLFAETSGPRVVMAKRYTATAPVPTLVLLAAGTLLFCTGFIIGRWNISGCSLGPVHPDVRAPGGPDLKRGPAQAVPTKEECLAEESRQCFECILPYERTDFPQIHVHKEYSFDQADGSKIQYKRRWGDSDNNMKSHTALAKLASLTRAPDYIVEFGTFTGMATYHMAENSPEGVRLITVDFNASSGSYTDSNAENHPYPKYKPGEVWVQAPEAIRQKITQMIGDSTKIDFTPYYGKVGLIWLDGGHSREVCLTDMKNALCMLRPGGYMVLDDVGGYWPGVPLCVKDAIELVNNGYRCKNGETIKGRFVTDKGGPYAWFRRACST